MKGSFGLHAPDPGRAILLVEDDDFNRTVATAMLRASGYLDVTTAVNGVEAVAACERETFDLILMDCEMPLMNGWDATRKIRALGICTPIVAYTASVAPADRSRCLEVGMNDFLAKPASTSELASMLSHWVKLSRA